MATSTQDVAVSSRSVAASSSRSPRKRPDGHHGSVGILLELATGEATFHASIDECARASKYNYIDIVRQAKGIAKWPSPDFAYIFLDRWRQAYPSSLCTHPGTTETLYEREAYRIAGLVFVEQRDFEHASSLQKAVPLEPVAGAPIAHEALASDDQEQASDYEDAREHLAAPVEDQAPPSEAEVAVQQQALAGPSKQARRGISAVAAAKKRTSDAIIIEDSDEELDNHSAVEKKRVKVEKMESLCNSDISRQTIPLPARDCKRLAKLGYNKRLDLVKAGVRFTVDEMKALALCLDDETKREEGGLDAVESFATARRLLDPNIGERSYVR